ncbi:probable inactive leucine-rich repeat receptor kinase XIAO [Pistacia vera]|uniref:probable inactive leucine-rich repeat receptor kinase XIAO n=1 Tax=Pistacia vera TaxID=55513 RepID=UPI0012632845|nr:probable inactive leucine-rich repeat receptor kinase XIAO [Pistacia vera]
MASQSTKWANPLSFLSNLQGLQLSNCRIFGKIPTQQLLNLTSLSVLAMDFNSLSSPIPSYLSNLTSLFVLDLTNTWPQLEILDISATQVQEPLPTSFANTTLLRYFRAQNCLLRGPLPASMMNLSKLERLELDFVVANGREC